MFHVGSDVTRTNRVCAAGSPYVPEDMPLNREVHSNEKIIPVFVKWAKSVYVCGLYLFEPYISAAFPSKMEDLES